MNKDLAELEKAATYAQSLQALAQSMATPLNEAAAEAAKEIEVLIKESPNLTPKAIGVASNRAKVLLIAADSWLVQMALRVAAYGKNAGGDPSMIRFLLKARGLAVPNKPVDDDEREAADKRALELADLPTDELMSRVIDKARSRDVKAETP